MARKACLRRNGKAARELQSEVMAARLVFVSGTAPGGSRHWREHVHDDSRADQTCLATVAVILGEAGSSRDKLVSATVILADEDDFAGLNEEWLRWFPGNPPARQGAKFPVRIAGLEVSIADIAEG